MGVESGEYRLVKEENTSHLLVITQVLRDPPRLCRADQRRVQALAVHLEQVLRERRRREEAPAVALALVGEGALGGAQQVVEGLDEGPVDAFVVWSRLLRPKMASSSRVTPCRCGSRTSSCKPPLRTPTAALT